MKKLSEQQWGWIGVAVVVVVLLLLPIMTKIFKVHPSVGQSQSEPSPRPSPRFSGAENLKAAKACMAARQYKAAIEFLDDIREEAPEYAQAQQLIVVSKNSRVPAEIEQAEQARRTRDQYQKRYEKYCHIGYLYQIEERLQREGFQMDHSGFEKAPDGSNGVRRYFSKGTNDGFVIKMWLQSGYSMSAYYCVVDVEGT